MGDPEEQLKKDWMAMLFDPEGAAFALILVAVALVVILVVLQTYYLTVVVGKAKLYIKPGSQFGDLLRRDMPVLEEPFEPLPWCVEPRLQSILGHVIRGHIPKPKCTREVLKMPDGVQIGLDWLVNEPSTNDLAPTASSSTSLLVLVFPGLAGTSRSDYIRSLSGTILAHHKTVRMVMVCFQGLNRLPIGAPRLVSCMSYLDVSRVVNHVSEGNPNAPILAVGASAGAHMLGTYLVMKSAEARKKLTSALFLCNLWDYSSGMANMERGYLNMHINRHIAEQQVKRASRYRDVFEKPESKVKDVDLLLASKTMREFDNRAIAPTNGFKDVEELYRHIPLHKMIHDINLPALAIQAADDQFQPERMLPLKSAMESDKLAMMVTKRGGHLAFMEGWIPKQYNYLERAFSQYVSLVEHNVDLLNSL